MTEKECIVCYRELNTTASYFSCEHNVLCAECNHQWTKSCPLCRSSRKPTYQQKATLYTELNIDENEPHLEMSQRTQTLLHSNYGIEILRVSYEKRNDPLFVDHKYRLRFYVDRTNHLNGLYRILASIYTNFSVTTTHTNNCIHVYF